MSSHLLMVFLHVPPLYHVSRWHRHLSCIVRHSASWKATNRGKQCTSKDSHWKKQQQKEVCEQYNYCVSICVCVCVWGGGGGAESDRQPWPKVHISQQNSDEQINFSVWLLFWYSVLFSGSSGSQTKALINNTKKSKREVPERTGRTEAKKWGDKRDTGKQKGQKKRQKNGECEDRGKDAGRAEVRRESLLSSWMVLCTVQSIQASPPSSPHHLCLLFSSMKHDPS